MIFNSTSGHRDDVDLCSKFHGSDVYRHDIRRVDRMRCCNKQCRLSLWRKPARVKCKYSVTVTVTETDAMPVGNITCTLHLVVDCGIDPCPRRTDLCGEVTLQQIRHDACNSACFAEIRNCEGQFFFFFCDTIAMMINLACIFAGRHSCFYHASKQSVPSQVASACLCTHL